MTQKRLELSAHFGADSGMISTADILESIIDPERGEFSLELAKYVLELRFPTVMKERYLELSCKAQLQSLNIGEREELEAFLEANALLMVLQSKARNSISKPGPAS